MAPKAKIKSKAKYTKGDWWIAPAVGTATITITSDGGIPLAYVAGRDIEAQSNAALMATAKDLLACLAKWQEFMHDNYLPGDITFWTRTDSVIARATGLEMPSTWRAALPDLVGPTVDPLAGIAPEVRRHIWTPHHSSDGAMHPERCRARVFDDYAWHQCGRKGTRGLGSVKFCTQHYRVVVADIGREKKAAAK